MTFVDAQRLLRGVFWARLGVAALLLPVGLVLPDAMMPGINHGVLVLALLTVATSSGGLLLGPPLAHPRRIAWLVALLDVALVTAVVAATGGPRSIFTFLYVMLVTASCVTLSRTGGLTIAAVASALYTALVFGRTVFPITSLFEAPEETTALEIVTMFLNTATFLVVAIVAGGLAERFQIQSRTLRDLRAMKDLVFDSVGTGLIAVDPSHTITTFNRAAATITGVPAVAAVGRAWERIFGDLVSLPAIEAELAAGYGAVSRHEAILARERLGQIVLKESGRLNDILRDFLEYARPAPLARARKNVVESIDDVLVLLEHRATPGTLKTVREFPPSLEWLVDPQQFRQAVWNLCLNAVQAMPDGGELRVTAAVVSGRLEVRVADTGEGIP